MRTRAAVHIRAHGRARLPMVGRHEGSGVVVGIGPGVTRVQAGDRVSCSYIPVCGKCRYCSTGKHNLCDAGLYAVVGRPPDQTFRFHQNGEDFGCMCVVGSFAGYSVLSATRSRPRRCSSTSPAGSSRTRSSALPPPDAGLALRRREPAARHPDDPPVGEGRIKLTELITKKYTLDEINEGSADLMDGKDIRGVIVHRSA
jgi:Zn-dependent alcohol dehydrogenase